MSTPVTFFENDIVTVPAWVARGLETIEKVETGMSAFDVNVQTESSDMPANAFPTASMKQVFAMRTAYFFVSNAAWEIEATFPAIVTFAEVTSMVWAIVLSVTFLMTMFPVPLRMFLLKVTPRSALRFTLIAPFAGKRAVMPGAAWTVTM